MATVTEVYSDDTVDVEYDHPYNDVEKRVDLARIRSIGKSVAKAMAMRALRRASWQELMTRVARDIGPQPHYRVRTRKGAHMLYTHEQAIALAGDVKRQRVKRGRHQNEEKRPGPYDPNKQNTRTKLEDADVDPQRAKKPEKRTKEDDDQPGQNKHVKFMCLLCKDNNRRFNPPPPDKCNYAKGGIWHVARPRRGSSQRGQESFL